MSPDDSQLQAGDAPSVALFMTRGFSLRRWDRQGMFEREVALYERLRDQGVRVGVLSYGHGDAMAYGDRLPGIEIADNRWRLPWPIYCKLAPWLHRDWLATFDVFKSNQTLGANVALSAAHRLGKPLIARCGFMLSEFQERHRGRGHFLTRRARAVEERVFAAAAQVVVTTPMMQRDVHDRLGSDANVTIIPNYVDTQRFRPDVPMADTPSDLCFVGRLDPQKNVEALLEAIEKTSYSIAIVGEGPLGRTLRDRFGDLDGRARWLGAVSHDQLPALIRASNAFVLPSLYEGHPKSLIEAMACGAAVVAGDVPGIREVIEHGETGYLCGTDADSVRDAIDAVIGDETLRERLGGSAARFAQLNYSLDRIVELELDVLRKVGSHGRIDMDEHR